MRSPYSDLKIDALHSSFSSVAATSRLFDISGYGKALFAFNIGPLPSTQGTLAFQATVVQATAATATPTSFTPGLSATFVATTAATGANFTCDELKLLFVATNGSVATGAAAWTLSINGATFASASAASASARKFLASSAATSIESLATVINNSSHGISSIVTASTAGGTLVVRLNKPGDTYITAQTNSTAYMIFPRFRGFIEVDADHLDNGYSHIGLQFAAVATAVANDVTLIRYQPRQMPVGQMVSSACFVRSSAT